jgi:four helix bundle protein
MKLIQDLDIYKLAETLSDKTWTDYDTWPTKAKITIGHQIIRSADSIAANLAEGFGRGTGKDKKRFFIIARGSFEETKAWLRKAARRKIIPDTDIKVYGEIINELGPKLNAFIKATI